MVLATIPLDRAELGHASVMVGAMFDPVSCEQKTVCTLRPVAESWILPFCFPPSCILVFSKLFFATA